MVKRGSLVTIARPERPERPDRPVNNREKEKDPNAPGCKYLFNITDNLRVLISCDSSIECFAERRELLSGHIGKLNLIYCQTIV